MREENVLNYLATGTHLGGTNLDFQMQQCINKKKVMVSTSLSLKKTWENRLLAAGAIAVIENPADGSPISSRNTGQ